MRSSQRAERERQLYRKAQHRYEAPGATEPNGQQSMLDLQRRAGNQAVSAMLRELSTEPAPTTEGLEVSPDLSAEHEADRVADAAVRQLGQDASKAPLVGGTLSPTLRRALGAVAPDVGAIDKLRVHTDGDAHAATDSINARAFTSGREVSVAKGELDNHVEGNRLIAHEAAHSARHQSPAGGELVHAKLRGTKDALISQGGGETSGKLRKLVHSKTNWDTIVDSVGAYEELEATVLKSGTPTPSAMTKVTPKMLQQLSRIESACAAWEKANKDTSGAKKKASKKLKDKGELTETDERSKAERRQAIAMLLPRVRLEVEDLQNARWTKSLGLSDRQMTKKGREDQGQMNVVKELTYVTESGEFSGYFKEDKGFAKTIQGWEGTVGITQHDPNYGARSVAMYRLDKLLGAEVTARAEFAANEGKLGTVIESAKGKAAVDTQFSNDEEQQQKSKGSVLTSDPVLQRAMNKLQILDAICGQLDRHEGNWFVETDEKTGKVKGVKGIDLDMAFGSEMKGVEEKDSDNAQNYLGMPEMIDDEFAQRIMLIRPDDIRNTLKGLLPDNEVEATVIRFTSVRAKIEQVAKTRGLTKVWDQSTANENRLLKSVMMSGHKSYGTKVNAAAVRSALDAMREDAIDAVNHGRGPAPFRNELQYMLTDTDLPEKTAKGLREALIYQVSGANMLKEAVWSGKVPAGKTSAVAMQLLNAVLNDADGIMTQLIIAVQEMDSEANPYMVLQPMLEKFMIKLLPALIANLPVNA